MRCLALGLALAAGLLGAAAAASGEARWLQVVGAVPAGPEAASGGSLRRAALDEALLEAVARVARDEARTAGEPAAESLPLPTQPRGWMALLGGSPADYALEYRLLEDRGERRALLVADPDVETEYVVLAEVRVDVDRVRAGLRAAGVLPQAPTAVPGQTLRVVVQPLPSYAALLALREALAREPGSRVVPERFEPGRAVLRMETHRSAAAVLGQLRARLPEGIELGRVRVREGELHLELIEGLAAAARRSPQIDTRGANRY